MSIKGIKRKSKRKNYMYFIVVFFPFPLFFMSLYRPKFPSDMISLHSKKHSLVFSKV